MNAPSDKPQKPTEPPKEELYPPFKPFDPERLARANAARKRNGLRPLTAEETTRL